MHHKFLLNQAAFGKNALRRVRLTIKPGHAPQPCPTPMRRPHGEHALCLHIGGKPTPHNGATQAERMALASDSIRNNAARRNRRRGEQRKRPHKPKKCSRPEVNKQQDHARPRRSPMIASACARHKAEHALRKKEQAREHDAIMLLSGTPRARMTATLSQNASTHEHTTMDTQ